MNWKKGVVLVAHCENEHLMFIVDSSIFNINMKINEITSS